jgi:hypothetical protein
VALELKTRVLTWPLHGLQQAEAALDVVGVVIQGLGHRLAHGLEAGEVDDGADLVRLQGVA